MEQVPQVDLFWFNVAKKMAAELVTKHKLLEDAEGLLDRVIHSEEVPETSMKLEADILEWISDVASILST